MTLYEKYAQEKEKYCTVFKAMKISYNKEKNSILYTDGRGYILSVQYSVDMNKIENVFAKCREAKWQCLTKLFQNLGSDLWYYDFSNPAINPFCEVSPMYMEAYETQGLFDIIMSLASEYIKQENMDVVLGVQYSGWGYAYTPVAVAEKGRRGLGYRQCPYDENMFYTKDYFDRHLKKDDLHYLKYVVESRTQFAERANYLEAIYERIAELENERKAEEITEYEK